MSSKAGHEPWMAGKAWRREDILEQAFPVIAEWPNQSAITSAVNSQSFSGLIQRLVQQDSGAIIERMRERRRWKYPLQSMFFEWQRAQKRRANRHGIDGRADIV